MSRTSSPFSLGSATIVAGSTCGFFGATVSSPSSRPSPGFKQVQQNHAGICPPAVQPRLEASRRRVKRPVRVLRQTIQACFASSVIGHPHVYRSGPKEDAEHQIEGGRVDVQSAQTYPEHGSRSERGCDEAESCEKFVCNQLHHSFRGSWEVWMATECHPFFVGRPHHSYPE